MKGTCGIKQTRLACAYNNVVGPNPRSIGRVMMVWCGSTRCVVLPVEAHPLVVRGGAVYFATGMVNSAPLAMLSGQRCITDFCLV